MLAMAAPEAGTARCGARWVMLSGSAASRDRPPFGSEDKKPGGGNTTIVVRVSDRGDHWAR